MIEVVEAGVWEKIGIFVVAEGELLGEFDIEGWFEWLG